MTKYHCSSKVHRSWRQGNVSWVGYDISSLGEIYHGKALEEPAIKIQPVIQFLMKLESLITIS
jgi:hypothetical protein